MERKSIDETVVHNGQCVMAALVKNGAITHNDLLANFVQRTEEPIDQIESELEDILTNGIAGGFILKKGNKYAIPGFDSLYETDADKSCETGKDDTPKSVSVAIDGVEITISVSKPKGKRKAEDEACTRPTKKRRMYEDDDDGEDFEGFDGCK